MARQRSTRSGSDRDVQSGATTVEDQAQGGGAVEQARGKAQQLASQAQEKTTQQVQSGLAKGKSRAAETLGGVAQSLRSSSQQLRDQQQDGASRYIERAADQVQRFSDYLQSTEVNEMVDRVEDIARRQPALFVGGAFTLGLLGARFLKSSRRRQGQAAGAGYWGAGGTTGRTYAGERDVTGFQGVAAEVPRREWATPAPTASPSGPTQAGQPGFGSAPGQTGYAAPPPGPEGTEERF